MVSRFRRKGFRKAPRDGWPLDEILVGVATLRTIREMVLQGRSQSSNFRAWDLALWSGVSPQGSANSLERLERLGLVQVIFPGDRFRAKRYRVDWSHPLCEALAALFVAERTLAGRRDRALHETDPTLEADPPSKG